jgi:hypothetical protein
MKMGAIHTPFSESLFKKSDSLIILKKWMLWLTQTASLSGRV